MLTMLILGILVVIVAVVDYLLAAHLHDSLESGSRGR